MPSIKATTGAIFNSVGLTVLDKNISTGKFGSGKDGDVTISTSVVFTGSRNGSGLSRTCDQPAASVTAFGSSSDPVGGVTRSVTTLNLTMRAGVIADFIAGDLCLLINQKGDSNYGNVGNWEIVKILSVNTGANSVKLNRVVSKIYGATSSNSTLTGQKINLYRLPEFRILRNNGAISCTPWDGNWGGIIAYCAHEQTSDGSGLVQASGCGYLGGASAGVDGETYNTALGGGEGGATGANGAAGTANGSGNISGGGGGKSGGPGGGGGYATTGEGGGVASIGGDGAQGFTSEGGPGGSGGVGGTTTAGTEGVGGPIYGSSDIGGKIFMGAGGGAGGTPGTGGHGDDAGNGGTAGTPGRGGQGGGIILVFSKKISVTQFANDGSSGESGNTGANGSDGGSGLTGSGDGGGGGGGGGPGGGGGAAGSTHIMAQDINDIDLISTVGGAAGNTGTSGNGGAGGLGGAAGSPGTSSSSSTIGHGGQGRIKVFCQQANGVYLSATSDGAGLYTGSTPNGYKQSL